MTVIQKHPVPCALPAIAEDIVDELLSKRVCSLKFLPIRIPHENNRLFINLVARIHQNWRFGDSAVMRWYFNTQVLLFRSPP